VYIYIYVCITEYICIIKLMYIYKHIHDISPEIDVNYTLFKGASFHTGCISTNSNSKRASMPSVVTSRWAGPGPSWAGRFWNEI
jgi:hypothetical protein